LCHKGQAVSPGDRAVTDQPTVTAVSSTTNDVCSELPSVPVNLTVTELPAKLPGD